MKFLILLALTLTMISDVTQAGDITECRECIMASETPGSCFECLAMSCEELFLPSCHVCFKAFCNECLIPCVGYE